MKKVLALLLIVVMTTLTGCSSLKKEMLSAMEQNVDIQLSVEQNSYGVERNDLGWIELDQLETFNTFRRSWDDTLNIIRFDRNSKNGTIFVDTAGNWAGNNTLYNIFQNKAFVTEYWDDSKTRSKLSQLAISEFSDIEREGTGIVAAVNTYFNILPTNADGTSGMFNYVTRAEAMSAIYRGDTPVILLEEDENFKNAVGESQYNIYAQNLANQSFLDYTNNSLNSTTYNQSITRAETVYMLVQRFYKDEYDSLTGKETGLSDCKNAGRVADKQGFTNGYAWQAYELEYCLQNKDKGVTEDLYKALVIAKNHGIITSDTRWNEGILGGELIQMLINTYDTLYEGNTYLANAKVGANAGLSLIEKPEEEEEEVVSTEIETDVTVQKIKDISDIEKLLEVYGDEVDMTAEEIEEAKRIGEQYNIEPCDKYMLVDFCTYLNVRVGPGTEFGIKKSVPKETKVHIVGICAENGWYRVIADGKICYQCGVYFSDLPGQDTSNLVQEYETDEKDTTNKDTVDNVEDTSESIDTNEEELEEVDLF